MCSKAAANVGTLPRLASPLFIQLPKPFAHDDVGSDDDLKRYDDDNDIHTFHNTSSTLPIICDLDFCEIIRVKDNNLKIHGPSRLVLDILVSNIDFRYISTLLKNIEIDIDMVIFENIDIAKAILKNIAIDRKHIS